MLGLDSGDLFGNLVDVDDCDDKDDDANESGLRAALVKADAASKATRVQGQRDNRCCHSGAEYDNLNSAARSTAPHFDGCSAAGTGLALHPEWTVQTAA